MEREVRGNNAPFYTMNSSFKDGKIAIMLDKERHLLFSLNALDEMQERFGNIEELPNIMQGNDKFRNIRTLLTILLNEGAADGEEPLTEKQVGRLIHTGNFTEVQNSIMKAFIKGTNGDESQTGDDSAAAQEKNLTSEQG